MRLVTRMAVLSLTAGVALVAAPRPGLAARRATAARSAQYEAGFEKALIQPQQLLKEMNGPKNERPIVLQVGFEVLYRGAHIPGAIYAGPAFRPEGLANLRRAAARIPRDHLVVIYCGCCPMSKCPNIHPAYAAMRKMGFRRLQVLNLPEDFAHDWVAKGLPIVKGDSPR
jgi:hypothetical protein